jgi:hypothetical protein
MSNYPNMSYCMFENTVHAMNQVYRDLQEAQDDGISPDDYRKALSSRQEAEAYDSLKEMCEDIINVLNDMRYNDPTFEGEEDEDEA